MGASSVFMFAVDAREPASRVGWMRKRLRLRHRPRLIGGSAAVVTSSEFTLDEDPGGVGSCVCTFGGSLVGGAAG